MKNYLILSVIVLAFFLASCKVEPQPEPIVPLKEFYVAGNAQKGPFINGSRVTIYELSDDFKPTGRTFEVNTDEKGHFELKGVKLISPNIEILADGFYYNEVSGTLSNERIMLKAIVSLSDQSSLNINVLTHLVCERIKFLMDVKGVAFQAAKEQAQQELLKVFNMDEIEIGDAELLDIANTGQGDAVLLAVSSILQGHRTTAELSKLQADMIADMKEDGILDDTLIQSTLISHSRILNLEQIGQNMISKYHELGLALDRVNDFDQYVENFNLHSTFYYKLPFEFPATTDNKVNLLDLDVVTVIPYADYSFAVKMPVTGNVKIRLTRTDGNGLWYYQPMAKHGWQVTTFDPGKNVQVFTSTINSDIIDLPIGFTESGVALLEYYYNDATTPSHTKTITWGVTTLGFDFKFSQLGENMLAMTSGSGMKNGGHYVIGVSSDKEYDVTCKLSYPSTITCEVMGGNGNYAYVVLSDGMEINLKNKVFPDTGQVGGTSEVGFLFTGTGEITIETNLMQNDGTYLRKTLILTN